MILGCRVSVQPNDKNELQPTVASVDPSVRTADEALADNGYFCAEQIESVEADGGPEVYVATGKTKHGRTVQDLEKRDDPPPPPDGASVKERMTHRMSTRKGKDVYKARKETVEPVFGTIKEAMGFRQFHLRGHPKVDLEWCLVCLAFNVRRLFRLASSTGVSGLVQEVLATA